MTSIPGVDYAWSHPGGAALQKAGKHFACRYLSPDSSKNLTRAEADDLAAHGIWSVVVWESTASRALGGQTAGVVDARTAAVQAAACGMPSSRPIYFAVDFDATAGQQASINAYLDGAASVLGKDRVGIYGGYYPVKRALDAGKARWAWQTIAWSGGRWDPRAVMRQGAQATINGVSCDLNTATADDYGQWMPGKTPMPDPAPQQEDDMPGWISGAVAPGPQPTVILPPHGGAWQAVTHRRLHLGMDQFSSDPAKAAVRVAIHNGTKWRISTVSLTAAGGVADVPMTDDDVKVSLQTDSTGVAYAIESW